MSHSTRRMGISILILFLSISGFPKILPSYLHAQPAQQQNDYDTIDTEALNGLLNTHLQSMAGEAERDRLLGSYVMFGLGGLSTLGGAATLLYGNTDDRPIGWGLVGSGIVLSGLGFIPRHVSSEPERVYQEYRDMPDNTHDQERAKFSYGDNRFQSLAERARRQRIVSGVSSIVSALVSYGLEPDAEEFPALLIINAASQLFIPREVETRYQSYEDAKQDLSGTGERLQTSFRIFPLTGGAALSVQVRF